MKPFNIDLNSLPAQMILSFIALVLLTATAVGLPAIWLIRNQLEHQAWAQMEQGSRAAQALYAARQSEMTGLASLTAQRPTLRNLLSRGDQASLIAYLRTLQDGAGLDLVLACDSNHRPVAQAGEITPDPLCAIGSSTGFYVAWIGPRSEIQPGSMIARVWLLATHPVGDELVDQQGKVIVGMILDDEFAAQMRDQTGLEHTLLVNGTPVATSLSRGVVSRQVAELTIPDEANRASFHLGDQAYYSLSFPLSSPQVKSGGVLDMVAEVALEVTDIAATQRELARTLIASIVVVATVGSVLGTLLARRIGRPLARLTAAASTLRQGNLDSPVAVEAQVREVALVAQALEGARADLQHTLTELRQEKAWTDRLLESIVEGIMTLDCQGRITFFSPGAERITGWSRFEVLNRACDELFRPIETDKPFSLLIPPPGRRHKITVEMAQGRQATLAITVAQLLPPEMGDTPVAVVFRDVSEEEAVHRLIGHFLANVSHEFRTPLSSVAASVELLLDQATDLNSSELKELLTSLHLGILGLQTLVDNLLESASIEAGRFRVYARPSNPGKIIAEAIQMMQPLLDKHGQCLTLDLSIEIPRMRVRADPRRTVQVLVNLLSNASKYGPDEAEITLSATVIQGWVRVSVADRGPGVSAGYRNDLFRRFVHPDLAGDKSLYGAGLGLSVVKAVVEAQGGQVGVEDRPGGGLVFWFTLPVEGTG